MVERSATYKRLAAALPDIPRWLETRSLLLSGEGEVLGLDESAGAYVVRDPASQLISVVGRPDLGALREALFRSGDHATLLCQQGEEPYVASLVPGWQVSPATLHLLADDARVRAIDTSAVRFLTLADVAAAEMPDSLRQELRSAILWSEMTATVIEGKPVSFCYVASVTEGLWDISIDTLEEHRRRGYASKAVARMIDHMYERRKRPVWGAEDSNAASLAAARGLGFRPVDKLMVLRPPGQPA